MAQLGRRESVGKLVAWLRRCNQAWDGKEPAYGWPKVELVSSGAKGGLAQGWWQVWERPDWCRQPGWCRQAGVGRCRQANGLGHGQGSTGLRGVEGANLGLQASRKQPADGWSTGW